MHSGKKSTLLSFLLKTAFIFSLVFVGFLNKAQAQANDLMIVEYVDWQGGAGVAVKIYNPMPVAVNLANYRLRIYGNGSNTFTTETDLKGTLAPCATTVIGNDDYATINCTGSSNLVNYTMFSNGVNGDDVVALTLANGTYVDMIGRVGFSAGNGNSQKIGSTTDALFEKKIRRNQDNVSRYTLTSGIYNPANLTTANIWPNNTTTSVTGWTVVGAGTGSAGCLAAGLPLTWTAPVINFATTNFTFTCPVIAPGTLTINPGITANFGSTVGVPVLTWSGGAGTFANVNASTAIYTPGPGETGTTGTINLNVTATYMCKTETRPITIINGTTVVPSLTITPIVFNPCRQNSFQLNATVNNGTIKWTGGKGTFSPSDNVANPTYLPSPQDWTRLKLTATVTGGAPACPQVISQLLTFQNGDSTALTVVPKSLNFDCPQDSIHLQYTNTVYPFFEWTGNGKGTYRNKNAADTYYKPAATDFHQLKFNARVTIGCNQQNAELITARNGKDTLELATGFIFDPANPRANQPVTFSYLTNRPQTDIFGNWNYGDGTLTVKQPGIQQHAFTKAGMYSVTVDIFDQYNCPKGKFMQQIIVTDPVETIIPTIFTPNSDNFNDTYKPQLPQTSAYQINIYNRWGQLVFESNSQDKIWDGKNVTDGVYFVHLKATYLSGESIDVKTPVTIMR